MTVETAPSKPLSTSNVTPDPVPPVPATAVYVLFASPAIVVSAVTDRVDATPPGVCIVSDVVNVPAAIVPVKVITETGLT